MMRVLIIVALVGFAVWWLFGRRRAEGEDTPPPAPGQAAPQAMVACAHCGVHLPQADAVADAQGRLFCGDAHRLAGPR